MSKLNVEIEENETKEVKVSMDLILKLREEAARQKVQRDAKSFAKTLGNNGADVPDFTQESQTELDEIAEGFEITEE